MKLRAMDLQTVLAAKAATGADNNTGFHVEEFRTLVVELATADSASLTVKFAGSVSKDAPDFTAAKAVNNHYEYLNFVDLQNGEMIEGNVGVVLSGTDAFRLFEVNTNGVKFFNAVVTARAAGSVTIKVKPFTND